LLRGITCGSDPRKEKKTSYRKASGKTPTKKYKELGVGDGESVQKKKLESVA